MLESIINYEKTNEIRNNITNYSKLREKVNSELNKNNLKYNNNAYPLIINPIILSNKQKELNNLAKSWNQLINSLAKKIKEDNSLQKKINSLNPNYVSLIKNLIKNTNSLACFSRIDGILTENGIKLTEFNMNSPGGLLTLEKMHYLMKSIYEQEGILNSNQYSFQKGSDKLKEFLINSYRKKADNGLLAIIGNQNDEEKSEHLFWKKTLEDNEIPTKYIDYRDKKITFNKQLKHDGEKIDMVYRRLFPLNHKALIKAEENNSCYFINPLYSSIFGNKIMLSFLHELKNEKEFEYSKEFIENNIINTQEMQKTNYLDIKNKNKQVIKKMNSSGGKGVFIGKETAMSEWISLLQKPENKIIQEYVSQPKMNFIGNKRPEENARKFDFNLYILENKAIMPYIRVNAPNQYRSNNACGSSESICLFEK